MKSQKQFSARSKNNNLNQQPMASVKEAVQKRIIPKDHSSIKKTDLHPPGELASHLFKVGSL